MKITAVFAALILAAIQVAPGAGAPTQSGEKASVSGIVVRAGTADPVAGVRVALTGAANAARATVTNSLGRFSLADLDPGSYRLMFTSPGFARQEYGQRAPTGQGRPLVLRSGEAIRDISIAITPTANVSGRVLDAAGRPVTGIVVQLLRRTYFEPNVPFLNLAGAARTDDRGEYRLFWITPGSYYLVTGGIEDNIIEALGPAMSANALSRRFQETYYRNAADLRSAMPLELAQGAEISIDLTLLSTQLYHVRGRIVDSATGQPPQSVNFRLDARTLSGRWDLFPQTTIASAYNGADGTFELRNIVPGKYILNAFAANASANAEVEVTGTDAQGLYLALGASPFISGKFAIEGQSPSAISGSSVQILLDPLNDSQGSGGTPGRTVGTPRLEPDGTFRIINIRPGSYQLYSPSLMGGPAPLYYLMAARLGSVDLLDVPLVYSGADPGIVEVVFSPNVGQLDGVVFDEKKQPAGGVEVILTPIPLRQRSELYRAVRTDSNGRFAMPGLTPGDYRIFASDLLDNNRFDPERLKRAEADSTRVHIAESEKKTLELPILRIQP